MDGVCVYVCVYLTSKILYRVKVVLKMKQEQSDGINSSQFLAGKQVSKTRRVTYTNKELRSCYPVLTASKSWTDWNIDNSWSIREVQTQSKPLSQYWKDKWLQGPSVYRSRDSGAESTSGTRLGLENLNCNWKIAGSPVLDNSES